DSSIFYREILRSKIEESERSLPLDDALLSLDDEEFLVRIVRDVVVRVGTDDSFLRLLLRSAMEGHDLARRFYKARVDKVLSVVEECVRRRSAGRGAGRGVDPALAARTFPGVILMALLQRYIFRDPVFSR